VLTHFV